MKRGLISLLSVFSIVISMLSFTVSAEGGYSAKAYVLIDADTGRVIKASNENARLPMASTTKIMTTLLTLESGGLDTPFEIDSAALLTEGSSMGLAEGDVVTKRDLCYGMLLPSGNDAANAAALKLAGDYESFAELMNRRAAAIGMKNTSFVTPSGLHDKNHFSSAYDMAQLAAEAMKNEDFRAICSEKYVKLQSGGGDKTFYLYNSNKLLDKYKNCIGIKTGFTDEAGRCLVSAAQSDGVSLICVTLHASDDWNDHIGLYGYGFSVTKSVRLDELGKAVKINAVGGLANEVTAVPEEIPACTSINGRLPEVTAEYICPDFVYAPIEKGKYIGRMNYYADGKLMGSVRLKAAESCGYLEKEVNKSVYSIIMDFLKKLFKE